MNREEFEYWLNNNGWIESNLKDNTWEYERSYADVLYDELTINSDERMSLSYIEVGWGYTRYNNKDFNSYEECKDFLSTYRDFI
jgi:hypothetical protein